MNRMLILYIFLLLCGTVSAQRTVEWNDLQPLTDDAHRTVYYKKDSKRPLQGKYRIIRGLDEEHVKLSDGMINGDYHRYRDGVLRESGIYVKGKRNGTFTEYYQDGVTPRKETPIQMEESNKYPHECPVILFVKNEFKITIIVLDMLFYNIYFIF